MLMLIWLASSVRLHVPGTGDESRREALDGRRHERFEFTNRISITFGEGAALVAAQVLLLHRDRRLDDAAQSPVPAAALFSKTLASRMYRSRKAASSSWSR